jgi:type III secretion system low calcium response chaperone LcrH/SycD
MKPVKPIKQGTQFTTAQMKKFADKNPNFNLNNLSKEKESDKAPGLKKAPALMDILGISKEKEEKYYRHAYLLYNTGRYKDAASIFRNVLMPLHTTESKYILGLAACCHMLKEYKMAAGVYLIVSSIDPLNPIPFFHASDCYIQIGDLISATTVLEMAIKRAMDKKEYATLKQRAEITLNGLKKELLKLK